MKLTEVRKNLAINRLAFTKKLHEYYNETDEAAKATLITEGEAIDLEISTLEVEEAALLSKVVEEAEVVQRIKELLS